MKVIGIVGWSGSGKTTLIVRLLPILVGRGLRVSTLKHAHHAFDIDKPGKDSYEHRQAGATEVLVGSATRWALMHELRSAPEPTLDELLGRLTPVDLVLVEGFKTHPYPKIEVLRADSEEALWPRDPHIVAVATTGGPSETERTAIRPRLLDLDDPAGVADFIVEHLLSAGASR